jgi:hypothetical protein
VVYYGDASDVPISASGGATSEAGLETNLADVTDVFTNNDGTLADDDITDDSITSLTDVGSSVNSSVDDQMLVSDGNDFEGILLVNCDPANQKLMYSTATNSWSCQTDATGATSTLDQAFDNGQEMNSAECGVKPLKISNGGDDYWLLCVESGPSGLPTLQAVCDGGTCPGVITAPTDQLLRFYFK